MTCWDGYSSFNLVLFISYVILCNVLFAYLILFSIFGKNLVEFYFDFVRLDLTWQLKLFFKFTRGGLSTRNHAGVIVNTLAFETL